MGHPGFCGWLRKDNSNNRNEMRGFFPIDFAQGQNDEHFGEGGRKQQMSRRGKGVGRVLRMGRW
jgi:hypothetical protein